MNFHFDGLDPDVRRRWAALKELLGDEEAAMKAPMDEEELVGILAAGLNITKQEAVDLILTPLGIGGGEEATSVATKTERGRRDSRGRRIDKPNQPASRTAEEGPGPRRDAHGKRLNKPNDPRRFDSQRRPTDAGRQR